MGRVFLSRVSCSGRDGNDKKSRSQTRQRKLPQEDQSMGKHRSMAGISDPKLNAVVPRKLTAGSPENHHF